MPLIKRVDRPRTRMDALISTPPNRLRASIIKRGRTVNDIHSQLNPTRVRAVIRPRSIEDLQAIVRRAGVEGQKISVAGGRHAMGGQQFGTDSLLLDSSHMNRVLGLDVWRGLVEVEAGIQWPDLIRTLVESQRGRAHQLGIIQKQTGADRLSLGGAVSANIHGRGLRLKPIINDVESFVIIDAEGRALSCSRHGNPELFGLAAGGYG
ncbi:MAG: FAD-dependent oxidoreductase, partial [Acidobacteriota bacterium]|nr:FAD-dependent oxidoreductase [Acidobacteriota bacterium]